MLQFYSEIKFIIVTVSQKEWETMYDRISTFLSKGTRQKNLYTVTVCMFVFLILEKLFSGIIPGENYLSFSLGPDDLVYVAVYTTVTVLLAVKVRYKFILIPDSVLFCLKINTVISGLINLASVSKVGLITELSLIETLTESIFFSAFLTVLFIGKLIPGAAKFKRLCPLLCLGILTVCFPATVTFEALKIFVEEQYYSFPLHTEIFLFIRAVANEMFLDLPYALLVLLMFFVPHSNLKKK